MSTIDLFPIKIYKNFYEEAELLKETLFSKLDSIKDLSSKNNNVFMREGTLCSYHTASDLHLKFPNETKSVVNFVEEAAKDYWKELNYCEQLEPFVFQLWANWTPNGGYIDSHLHGNMPFTGVLYVDASPEQGNIFLENPLEMILMTQPISSNTQYPIGQELEVNTGDLIMFPGFLRHSVKVNSSKKPRLILGFNIGCRGNYWSSQWTQNNV
jgi:uncharacterized protein (TIGR02466 family)